MAKKIHIKEMQTTSLLLEWLPSRTNVGKDVGKKELSYTTGRNVN
jgi:hypothetical protein